MNGSGVTSLVQQKRTLFLDGAFTKKAELSEGYVPITHCFGLVHNNWLILGLSVITAAFGEPQVWQ